MTWLQAVALGISGAGVALGGVRWLRVAQREHYLSGCCFLFATRWWRSSPVNIVLIVLGLAGLVVGVSHAPFTAVAGAVAIVGPVGLGVRGRTSRLAWTARLRRVAVLSGVIAVGVTVAASLVVSSLATGAEIAAILALGSPIVVDLSLALLAPFENHLAMRFVHQAESVLARVDPTVVGITGSYGKTSTKGYIAHLLAGRYAVVASPKSYNNRAGLARTVNENLVAGTDVLVAEMGTYGPGEIAKICAWLPPKVAVITAIGPVHLERFGSLDLILKAKSEIAEPAGIVVLNVDDERLSDLAATLEEEGKRVVRCSAIDAAVDVAIVRDGDELTWWGDGEKIATLDPAAPALGAALTNVAVAIGVALALGCTAEEIRPRLGDLPVAENRLTTSVSSVGALVLDDTFNSNPAGARIALSALAAVPTARRVLVTPGMVELGSRQREENESFAAEAAAIADDIVIVARTNRRALVAGATRANPDIRLRVSPTREGAVVWVREELDEHAAVLYENDLPDHYA